MPRNITVTFNDGTSHVYQNAPDDITPDAVQARAEKEFSKPVKGLDGGASPTQTPTAQPVATDAAQGINQEQSIEEKRKARSDLADQRVSELAGGALARLPQIGNNLINAATYFPGKLFPFIKQANDDRNKDYQYADKQLHITDYGNSTGYTKAGGFGTDLAATAGVGSGLSLLAKGAGASPTIVSALATNGMKTGAAAAPLLSKVGAVNMLTRVGAGTTTGGASGLIADPENAGTSAAIGGALPPFLSFAGKAAGYGGRVINSLIQPFTEKGQEKIAGNIINKFAEGGPKSIDAKQIVPGSVPTLAEATGNAGIARLQSAARDLNPNTLNNFVSREEANAAARTAAFERVSGDSGKMDFYKASRAQAAGDLYGAALDQANAVAPTPYVKGQVTQLLKRPSINEASRAAQKLALERGDKPAMEGSLQALHDVKTALDDKISVAVRDGKGGEAAALGATKDKLLDVMEKLSPAYKEARSTYAEMSKPINQMEVLQGLKLTDAKGNITLSKVQSALDGLEKNMNASGIHPAKSLDDVQVNTLKAIRDDLLRQTNLNAGKSAGSNTFQNIATDQILGTMLPGKLGSVVNGKIGTIAGQAGNLLYSGANKKITNRLVDMMLDPSAAQAVMNPQAAQNGSVRTGLNALANYAEPVVYRSAPVLSSSR